MAIDWVATLQQQADLVLEISTEVAKSLDASDLTMGQASRLYRVVEQGVRDVILRVCALIGTEQ